MHPDHVHRRQPRARPGLSLQARELVSVRVHRPPHRRDNSIELQIKAVIDTDLRIEPDLTRWFPLYGAPEL